MNITKFDKPRTDVKSVLCFYNGKYPKITLPNKDACLPHRMFPNAKLYIRCNTSCIETKNYFSNLFKPLNVVYELVDEKLNCMNLDAEVLFIKKDIPIFFGGKIEKSLVNAEIAMQKWKREVIIFYNDEAIGEFDSLYNIIHKRKDPNFKTRNIEIFNKLQNTQNYENISILCNENKMCNWMDNNISSYCKERNITLSYLSDIILYDLKRPNQIEFKNKTIDGLFIAYFLNKRIAAFNKIFDGSKTLKLKVFGKSSNMLKKYTGDGEVISNSKSLSMYKNACWSFYMGKGTESLYLGATFYEPLLNNCPIFVWEGTDPEHKLFPQLDVYFKTEKELASKLEGITHEKLMDLLQMELDCIFK